jgi:hypothetical protein
MRPSLKMASLMAAAINGFYLLREHGRHATISDSP